MTRKRKLRRRAWRKIRPRKYDLNYELHRWEDSVIVRKIAQLTYEEGTHWRNFTADQLDAAFPGLFNVPLLHKALQRLARNGDLKRKRGGMFRNRSWAYGLPEEEEKHEAA